MDFRFGAGDRGPPGYTSSVPGPLPPPLEWQAPPRELVIREQVTRRLTEEWAKGDPAFARDLNRGFGPDPFFAPDRFMPPPPHAPMPMPMHPLPHAPPPVPFEEFGGWQGFGPPRLHVHAGFGERTRFLFGARWGSTPRPDPKHKLKLLEVEPSGRPEALSPKVPMMKSKADANAATIVPKKVQKLAEDWSCAPPYQVSAPSESGLNEHLGGREHKAKLAQCGVSKATKGNKSCLQTTTGNVNNTDPCDAPKKICMLVDSATCEAGLNEDLGGRKHEAKLVQCGVSKAIKDDKNCLQMTTGNENNTDPCDAPKEICMLVDGEMHEVVWKNNYLWCDRCRVRCDSKVIMAGHLRSKNHSKLNKVWTSIKAVRTNTDTKEGLPSCGSQVSTNSPTEIPAVIEGDINMTTGVDESGPVENAVQKEIHPRSKKHSKLNEVWTSIKAVRTNTDTKKQIHTRSKKQGKLNNVWTSIKAARTNTDTKEGLPSCGSQALSSNPKVPTMKRKTDANAATTVPKKVQKLAKDWSCALCQVSAPCEAALNEHLGGRKHKAKLAQCGVSKAIKDDKNCLQTPTGNENSTDPCDAPRKICMLVDGATCEAGLNEHLGGSKHKAKLAQCGVSKAIKDDKNCLQTPTGNENSTDPCDAPRKICMLVDGATCEAGLNDHLGGRKHKAKLAQCGVSKTIKDDKNCLQTTTGNENSTDPCDAPKKMCMLVDGAPSEGGLNEHLGGRKHKAKLAQCGVSKAIKDDKNCLQATTGNENSTDPCDAPKKICMLVDGATCEAGLTEHLGGRNIKAKLAQCGASKAIKDDKNSLHTTTGNKNSTDPCDAPKKIFLLIDGEMHEVVQKNKHLWCDRCRVRCYSNATMAGHLRSKKHSKLNKVWTSIKAVRTNTDTKEGLPSCGSQALSSNPKVPMVKRKADANAATTVPKKVQKPTKDWSCALCLVSRQCEAALNAHLGGTKHKAKLAQCGVSKTIKDGKNCSQTTTGNENSTDPCDAPKKICMLVDSAMHEVVRKDNYLWCDHCRVSCDNYATMACHLRCKKQSKLTKVCSSIKAVRTNTNTKEGLPSFGSQVNTNGSTEIPAVIEGDINMTTAVDESGPVENPVGKEMTRMATIKAVRTNTDTKEGLLSSCGSRVNTNGSIEIPAIIEGDINMTTAVYESGPVENPVRKVFTRMATIKAVRTNTGTKESLPSSCGSQVNTNGSTEIPAVIEGDINMTTAVDESGPVENPVQKEIQRMATIWAMFSC
ncbi:uncharacterized protein [Aegilops tauschii subsp. strangulata]|uniref:uncharacterized protein isoform X4 n=1 Tax=Aegilops tauschii subsp. strangulata TaxID=200361 RepID=UPI00098AB4D5|nr:uncharacterized protein LOC109767334 isoform X4 [Aegilops tauschii subsp. strangulata]